MAAPEASAQAAFQAWLKRSGAYVSPKLDLFGPGAGGDRTVRARAAVEAGEQLLLVPEDATLTMAPDGAASRCECGHEAQDPSRGARLKLEAARARQRQRQRRRRRPPPPTVPLAGAANLQPLRWRTS
jgi:hypothetical protein